MADSARKAARRRLSVAMIVRDESELLAGTIESVRPIAEEIVVLDTGSTDKTASLAHRLGAIVQQAAWTDDFAAARNQCLRQATGDFILWLDAGEQLDAESAAELRRFVDDEAEPTKVYVLWVETPAAAGSGCPEQVVQPRLVPNRPDLRFVGRVRESLQPSIEAAGLEVATAVGRIRRHPRLHQPDLRTTRAQRNLRLAELDSADAGGVRSARLSLVVGDAHHDLGETADARRAYAEAIEAAEHGSTETLEAYYGLLTTFDGDPTASDLALTTCLEALELFPLDAQLLLAMGNCLQERGRPDLAVRSFEAAVRHGQVDLSVWHLVGLAEVAADYLNLSLQNQGQDDRAREVLDEALSRDPDSVRLRRRLVELHVKHARCDEALGSLGRLAADRSLADAVRGACKAVEKDWTAATELLDRAYAAGCRDPLCLRWLTIALLANGQVEAARPALVEWNRIDPSNAEARNYLTAMGPPIDDASSQSKTSDRRFRLDRSSTASTASRPASPGVAGDLTADAPARPE